MHKGYDYSRVANPTRTALQIALASLENATHGVAFSSGLGATTTLMHLVDPGERVVLIADVYGGVYRMTSQVYEPKGYRFTYVPADEFDDEPRVAPRRRREARLGRDAVEPAAERRRHPQAADAAHAVGALLVVDNTFATPVPAAAARARRRRGRALDDEVPRRPQRRRSAASSRTNDDALAERLLLPAEVARRRARARSTPGSSCAGSRRSRCACASTARTRGGSRSSSTGHAAVERVLYPGLPSHPGHERRARADARLRRHGLVPRASPSRRRSSSSRARKLFQLAESLGGVESLIEHPARMTHASTAGAPFAPPANLVRLSVGIESADDLIADLEAALVRRPSPARAHRRGSMRPIDLHFGGREQAVGVYLVDTDDGPALFDCGPDDDAARARGGARGARARARATSGICCSRTSTSTTPGAAARSCASIPELTVLGLRGRRAAPRRPFAARALGAAALRRRASTRSGASSRRCPRRTSASPPATCSAGSVPDAGARVAPRQLPPRRDAARRRRGRRPHAGRRLRPAGRRRRPTSTSSSGTRRSTRSAARSPSGSR